MPEKIEVFEKALKNVDVLVELPISKDDLLELFKKVLEEFPTNVSVQDTRITITIDHFGAPPPEQK